MTTFEARAAGTDAAVWTVLTSQMQNLSDADDINAVMSGAVMALARLIYHTLAEPGVTQTVEAMREMSCHAATGVHTQALRRKE